VALNGREALAGPPFSPSVPVCRRSFHFVNVCRYLAFIATQYSSTIRISRRLSGRNHHSALWARLGTWVDNSPTTPLAFPEAHSVEPYPTSIDVAVEGPIIVKWLSTRSASSGHVRRQRYFLARIQTYATLRRSDCQDEKPQCDHSKNTHLKDGFFVVHECL
jgi:hypothetical protein